ncbi:MAG: hypothetical protein ABI824_13340 [Acidobacteriota bacterium]
MATRDFETAREFKGQQPSAHDDVPAISIAEFTALIAAGLTAPVAPQAKAASKRSGR